MGDTRYEQSGSAVLFWVLWGGLGLATAGEVALFSFMGADGGATDAAGYLPPSQLVFVGLFGVVALGAAAFVKVRRIGGGGFPTALICWMLLKSIAVSGLVVYQLADNSAYYWPFLAVFAVGMAALNPTAFER